MRILIADDHAIVRRGLIDVLLEDYPAAEVTEVSDAESLFTSALQGQWDLIVSDLSMPGRSGLEIIQDIRQHFPRVPTLVLSIHPEELYGARVLKAGASGFLNKDAHPDELKKAVRWILLGRKYITPTLAEKLAEDRYSDKEKPPHEALSDRELHVMRLLASGDSLTRIGEQLSISPSTASSYRARVLRKMTMHTNTDLTRYCIEHKLI
jgi:two-component system invasion response regulator UvrY